MHRDRANRIVAGLAWLFACLMTSVSFATFGWAVVSSTLHLPRYLIYIWMCFAIIQFVFMIYALFRGLDDIFYKKDDRRRLMRRKGDR